MKDEAKGPHPDHDHEYTVPDMVPALSQREREVVGQLDAKTPYTISIFANFFSGKKWPHSSGKAGPHERRAIGVSGNPQRGTVQNRQLKRTNYVDCCDG